MACIGWFPGRRIGAESEFEWRDNRVYLLMSRKTRILLAEDDPCLSLYVQTILSRWDCKLAIEPTAEGAIQRAATFKPDVALLG
jgi:hypothetical protein